MPIDWAEQNVIVGRDSPAPGPFRRETMPLLVSVMNAVLDPRYESVVATASTQSGKSQTLNQIILGYWLEYLRQHTGFCIANRKIARRVYKTKLKPMFDAVPALGDLIPQKGAGSRGGFPTEQILNNGAIWLFLGMGSAADLSQTTVENMIIDETDKADEEAASGREANPIEQAVRRTDAHQLDRKLVYTCTPTTKTGFIWRMYTSGTEGRPWFRCPECLQWFWFEWSFDDMRLGWDDDGSEVAAMRSAYYRCPHCAHKIRDDERTRMLRYPLWVHAGERIESCKLRDLDDLGTFDEAVVIGSGRARKAFRVTGTRKDTRVISFWWNRLTSPFTTLGHMAASVRAAREDESRKHAVTIYDMALPYEGRLIDSSELTQDMIMEHARFSDYHAGRRGRFPFRHDVKSVICTAGVDIGMRELYMVADAWEVDHEMFLQRSWRIAYLLPYTYPHQEDPRSIFRALEHVRAYLMAGFRDSEDRRFNVSVVGIDAHYQRISRRNRRTVPVGEYQVYEFCRQYGQGTWRAVFGEDTLGGEGIVMPTRLERQGVILWRVDTDVIKCDIHQMLRIQAGKPGFWHIPQNTGREYARGMCAEKRVVDFDKHNREQAEWIREDPFNHPFDCEVYSWAMARSLGVRPPRLPIVDQKQEDDDVKKES